ncbi:MAG: reverse transcriptase domain-containing protein [bacterium]
MAQVISPPTFDVAFSRDALGAAWLRLKESKTDILTHRVKIPGGWDGVTVRRFERQLNQHLAAIERQVRSGRYTFRPFLYHFQPKVDGGERKIAYSGIRDRIVQAALHDVMAPAIDARLTDSAFAYRSGISTHDAIRRIYAVTTRGQAYFVKSDFVKFFDKLDHARLRVLLDGLDVDVRARQLAWRFLRTGDVARDVARKERSYPPSRGLGVPQGGVISGLLANLYLASFDEAVRSVPGTTLVRYADDFLVFCRDEETCRAALSTIRESANSVHLELHDGTKTVECGHIDDGVNFVGFRVRGTRISVKPTNVVKFKRRLDGVIRAHVARLDDRTYENARECVQNTLFHINRKVVGIEIEPGVHRSWIACFRIVNDVAQVRQLDRWMRGRISGMMRRVGFRHASRSELLAAGYHPLLREYWSVRRKMGAPVFPFRGMVGTSDSESSAVQEGALSYEVQDPLRVEKGT